MNDTETPVVLYRAKNLFEAQTLVSALQDAGLTARLEGEYLGTALGDIPLGIATAPRVAVRSDQLSAAKKILADFLSPAATESSESDEEYEIPE